LLQKGYIIYMEDNHYVIMDRYPRNHLITRIQMTSNIMFPLTLKPVMKRKIKKDVEDSGAEMQVAFQYFVQDDS